MTLLLAIDTSTDQVGLALTDGEATAELSWSARQRQTVTILEGIDSLLRLAGRTIGEVEAVAVATGPGSFSGLRVGMSVAKGLVLAQEIALIGISTLLVAAFPHGTPGRPVVPVVGAGRRRLVWGVVDDREGALVLRAGPINGSATELTAFVDEVAGPILVAGEVPDEARTAWVGLDRIACPPPLERRPAALARLGWERWRRGEVDDPVALEPTYLHLASPG